MRRGRRRAALGPVLALALLASCDLAGPGGGCVRVTQGSYTFPIKRVVRESLAVRLTEAGADLLTARVKALILAFFEADAEGRAVVPLSAFGLGTLGTEVGPFSAELRDVVVTLDLASLDVDLVGGSSPARLRVRLLGGEIGLVGGVVAGALDTIFSPDLACGLANGPSGRLALASVVLEVTLATDADAALDVGVDILSVDLEDVGLSVVTDCDLPECQDGCGECQLGCGAADLAASLAGTLQGLLDGVVDELATFLADALAGALLDAVLNGRPLAVEGTLDVGLLAGALLPYLAGASPVGVLGRPAGDAFAVTGSGDGLGIEVVLDAGVDATPAHPCVGQPGADPPFDAAPLAPWPPLVPDSGEPYHLGLAVSGALVNEALWAAWKAGALCVDLTSGDVAALSAGAVTLTAAALEVVLPGLTTLVEPDAPVRFRVRPRVADQPVVRFEDPKGGATLSVRLVDVVIALEAQVGGHFLRLLSFEADADVALSVEALPGARLGLRVARVDVTDLGAPDDELFAEARLDVVVPLVVDLATGLLAERALTLDLDLSGLAQELLGVPLTPVVRAVDAVGDWLRVLVVLEEDAPPVPSLAPSRVQVEGAAPGAVAVRVEAPPGHEVQLRVGGGHWTGWLPVGRRVVARHPRLWLVGAQRLEARLRDATGRIGPAAEVGEVVVAAPAPASATVALAPPPAAAAAAEPPGGGCAGGDGTSGAGGLALLAAAVLAAGRGRRRRARAGLAALLALAALAAGGCVDEVEAPERPCARDDQCPHGWMCGLDGVCVGQAACAADGDCCPGAVCANGWCRPTEACSEARPCPGLADACEAGRCVPRACASAADCPGPFRCAAGRCLDGPPCGGSCPAGRACEITSGRCLDAPTCFLPCAPGEVRLVDPARPLPALGCGGFAVDCVCAALPEVPPGTPGFGGRLLSTPGGPSLVSYDPVYGDLVLSRWDAVPGSPASVALDGVPALPPTGRADGYRGGVGEPGPDRGRSPSAAWALEAGAPVVDALARDEDARGARHVRVDPASGAVLASSLLPVAGDAGGASCLLRDPGTARLVAWVYVAADPADEVARLVRAEAQVDPPASAADWTVETVAERALPPREARPCDGACGLLQVCVRPGAGAPDRCGSPLDGAACGGPCPPWHACARPADGADPACLPRVLPREGDLGYGPGVFVGCAAGAGDVVVAWYDRDLGALAAIRGPGGVGVPAWVDGGPAAPAAVDVGRHARVAVGSDGVAWVAYQDARAEALRVARQAGPGAPWEVEVVHEGALEGGTRDLGAWPAVAVAADGEPVVAYADATRGDVWLARRGGPGCWKRQQVLATGVFAWPDLVLAADGRVRLSALALGFGPDLAPTHAPTLLELPLPDTGCGGP